jgi:hypothetical protein
MSEKVICQSCHNSTDISNTTTCVHYEQPLKAYTDNEKDNMVKNETEGQINRKSGSGFFSFIALILIISLAVGYISIDAKKKQATFKIVDIHETMATSINQYDEFSLPDQVAAKMGDGRSKAVKVTWDKPIKVDSSSLGVKTYKGKVEGCSKTITYTINVLQNITASGFYNDITYNSTVNFNINFNADDRPHLTWVLFVIKKDGKTSNQFLQVVDGYVKDAIYLPFGQGTYEVSSWITVERDRYGNFCDERKFIIRNDDERDLRYLAPTPDVQSNSPEIIKLAMQITEGLYSDMEKTKAIHDWVASHIEYDVEGNPHEYSALETVHGRKAICNGYANLTAALNRAVGIKAKIISGTANNTISSDSHAWNETFIDGRWVIQDTTWDAGEVNDKKEFEFYLTHKYFDPDPIKFAKNHSKVYERE